MKQLIVNGVSLDLPPGFVLRMVRNNSMLIDDVLEGDYSYPIQLPATDLNRSFFKWLDKPESRVQIPELKVLYEENGITLIRGNLVVRKAASSVYECHILAALSKLASIKDSKIGELEYGGVRIIENGIFQNRGLKLLGVDPPTGLTISAGFGITTSGNAMVTWAGSANATLLLLKDEIELLAPSLYPGTTITVAVEGDEIYVTGQWEGDSPNLILIPWAGNWQMLQPAAGNAHFLKKHMNDVMSDPDSHDYLFAPVLIAESGLLDYTGTSDPVEFDHVVINNYLENSFVTTLKEGLDFNKISVEHPVCPFPKALYILKEILKEGDYIATGPVLEDLELSNLLIFSNHSLHWGGTGFYLNYNKYKLDFKIGDLLPNISIQEYIVALRNSFGIHFHFDDLRRACSVQFLESIVESNKFEDWNDKVASEPVIAISEFPGFTLKFSNSGPDGFINDLVPEISDYNRLDDVADNPGVISGGSNDIVFSNKQKKFYKTIFNFPTGFAGWEFLSYHFHPYISGNGEIEIDNKISPMTMFRGATYPGSFDLWLISQTKQKLNYYNNKDGNEDQNLRMFFYRGFAETNNPAYNYPLASFDNLDFDGNEIVDQNYVLCWESSKGLFLNFWKKYMKWRNSAQEVEYLIHINNLDYINLDMRKKIQIHGVNFFIKSIDISFPITAPARVTLIKC